eukprot:UN16178
MFLFIGFSNTRLLFENPNLFASFSHIFSNSIGSFVSLLHKLYNKPILIAVVSSPLIAYCK